MNEERIWILLSRKLAGEISVPEQAELTKLLGSRIGGPACRQAGDYSADRTGGGDTTRSSGGQAGEKPDLAIWQLLKDPELEAAEDESALDAAGVYWEKQQELLGEASHLSGIKRRKLAWLWLAAACITLLLAFFLGTLTQTIPEKQAHEFVQIRTGANEKKVIVLPDSSRLTLNENSFFSYDKDMSISGNRVAHLSGEGYFEIMHNPDAPFLIKTSHMDIRVMGTTFNLLASVNSPLAEATLFEGKIEVTLNRDQKNERKVVLRPEEKLTLSTGAAEITSAAQPKTKWKHAIQYTVSEIAKPPEENVYKENAWVCGKVVFENDSLGMVAGYLEEKYNVRIVFDHPGTKNSRLRGVFRDESLQSILEALKFIHAIKDYEINGSIITIY